MPVGGKPREAREEQSGGPVRLADVPPARREVPPVAAQTTLSALTALVFAAVHVLGPSMTFLRTTPRSAWLSLAGGVSVAYVFVHVLPELAEYQEHGAVYDRIERWLLAAAPLLGWALGLAVEVPPLVLSSLFAFLMGGVVLNVLKEELPEDRESRFWAFAAGTAAYAALLIVTR